MHTELVDNSEATFLQWLAPRRCWFCAAPTPGRTCCHHCRRRLPWLRQACHRCALPLAGPARQRLCVACASRPPPQDLAWAGFHYASPIAQQILGLKFKARLGVAALLAELLAGKLAARSAPLPALLLPVPLHAHRLQQRGYNQSQEIGRHLARILAIELVPQAAQRSVATREQSRLDARARTRNVRNAFNVGARVRGRHVALLDDVITTGATMSELARAVRRSGARKVEAWAVARAALSS